MTRPKNEITNSPFNASSLDWNAFDSNPAILNKLLDQSENHSRVFTDILHHAVSRFHNIKNEASKKTLEIIAAHPAKTSYMNYKNSVGQTPLHFASTLNNPEAFKILLNNNSNPNIVDNDGHTPREKSQDPEIRNMLLSHSNSDTKLEKPEEVVIQNQLSDPNQTKANQQNEKSAEQNNETHNTEQIPVESTVAILHSMCETPLNNNTIPLFTNLIDNNIGIINCQNDQGETALHVAIKNGNQTATQNLIMKNPKLEIKDKAGKTALHYLAQEEKVYEMQQVIEKGADLKNIKDDDGKTVLDYMDSYSEEMKELLNSADKIYANAQIYAVAATGTIKDMEILIKKGAEINQMHYGSRALHRAAGNGNQPMVEFLIKEGAKVDAEDTFNRTPLHVAQEKGYKKIVELLKNGAKENIGEEDVERSSQLTQNELEIPEENDSASQTTTTTIPKGRVPGSEQVGTSEFKSGNGQIEANSEDRVTKIFDTVQNGESVESVEGFNVNYQNNLGNKLLHYAADNGDEQNVQLLIGANADPTISNKNGETSSGSTETTSLFSIRGICSGIWSFFTSFLSGGNSSDVGEGHSNNSTAHESNHSEKSNITWSSWLGSLFKGLRTQKVQDKSTTPQSVVQNQTESALDGEQIDTITNKIQHQDPNSLPLLPEARISTNEEVIQQIIAGLPDLPKDEAPTTLGDASAQDE